MENFINTVHLYIKKKKILLPITFKKLLINIKVCFCLVHVAAITT